MEFAILAPVLILVFLVAADFGRVLFSYIQINNAAREGAAYAIAHPNDAAGIRARAGQETNVQWQTGEAALAVTVVCSPGDCATAYTAATPHNVLVTVSEPFTFLTPAVGGIVGNLTITASATSVSLGAAGLPASPPACATVPNVVNMTRDQAIAAVEAAGLVPNGIDDLTTGTKNQVVSPQTPSAGSCVNASTTPVTFHYRPSR